MNINNLLLDVLIFLMAIVIGLFLTIVNFVYGVTVILLVIFLVLLFIFLKSNVSNYSIYNETMEKAENEIESVLNEKTNNLEDNEIVNEVKDDEKSNEVEKDESNL